MTCGIAMSARTASTAIISHCSPIAKNAYLENINAALLVDEDLYSHGCHGAHGGDCRISLGGIVGNKKAAISHAVNLTRLTSCQPDPARHSRSVWNPQPAAAFRDEPPCPFPSAGAGDEKRRGHDTINKRLARVRFVPQRIAHSFHRAGPITRDRLSEQSRRRVPR
jgi:hypothetical protein